MQVASADDPPPLSVSGHETRVLGNRSCRFGRRGALNGVTSEIMQMYTHHLTGNSRSVPSRTWVSPQWTCCRRQQSGEGLDTHIIVLWQCTECKGLAIGDTSSPNSKTTKSPPILSPLAENKDLVTWRLAVKPLKQCGNHASSVGQNQLSVKSTMIVLRPIGNVLNNVYLQLPPQLPLLCPPLLNINHLKWATTQKLQ